MVHRTTWYPTNTVVEYCIIWIHQNIISHRVDSPSLPLLSPYPHLCALPESSSCILQSERQNSTNDRCFSSVLCILKLMQQVKPRICHSTQVDVLVSQKHQIHPFTHCNCCCLVDIFNSHFVHLSQACWQNVGANKHSPQCHDNRNNIRSPLAVHGHIKTVITGIECKCYPPCKELLASELHRL